MSGLDTIKDFAKSSGSCQEGLPARTVDVHGHGMH